MIDKIAPSNTLTASTGLETNQVDKASKGFSEMMKSMIDSVQDSQQKGDLAIEQMQTGEARHLHDVMISVEEADVSLRMLVQLRNKAVAAYEEIMRMQI